MYTWKHNGGDATNQNTTAYNKRKLQLITIL